ncbi:hypothetical protein [Salinibacter ruber]|uniref:hypothetical protein n=1 Tax=Salinibacter ruber TaxID=146919 RepID=UPI002167F281|nr:hypothetical protein [Salinibacter ruber]MCS4174786.1 hypothetical protein [Salinibacter ruber]
MGNGSPTETILERTGANWKLGVAFAVLALELAIVMVEQATGGLMFVYYLGLTVVAYRFLVGEKWVEPLALFAFYSGLIIGGYYFNLYTFPEYYGFTPAGIAGTDDSHFFSLAAASLPSDFPTREFYHVKDHPYSLLLKAVTPIPIHHPFEVLFFNALGATFLPVFSRMLSAEVFKDQRVAQLTFWLVAFGPFLLTNSVVLVRDGWTAALFTGAIVFFLQRRFFNFALLGALLFTFRIASGLQLGLVVGILALGILRRVETRRQQIAYLTGLGVLGLGALLAAWPYLVQRMQHIGAESIVGMFFRQSFLEYLRARAGDSFLLTINSQPLPIRLPGAFLFYLIFPLVTPGRIVVQGEVIWRDVLMNLYSLAFIVYIKYLLQGLIRAIRSNDNIIQLLAVAAVVIVLFLSQASMQIRHKTMIMPLLYTIIAFGYYHATRLEQQIGTIALFVMALLSVVKFILGV